MTLKSLGGSTLQVGTWLWDDMTLNSPGGSTCNVARGSGIMTLNSLGGSILQGGTWLWDDVTLNSPGGSTLQRGAILKFYFRFRFRPYHRSRHVILHQSANFYPNRTTRG